MVRQPSHAAINRLNFSPQFHNSAWAQILCEKNHYKLDVCQSRLLLQISTSRTTGIGLSKLTQVYMELMQKWDNKDLVWIDDWRGLGGQNGLSPCCISQSIKLQTRLHIQVYVEIVKASVTGHHALLESTWNTAIPSGFCLWLPRKSPRTICSLQYSNLHCGFYPQRAPAWYCQRTLKVSKSMCVRSTVNVYCISGKILNDSMILSNNQHNICVWEGVREA